MKYNRPATICDNYRSPEVAIIDIVTERGFALSSTIDIPDLTETDYGTY